MPSTSTKTINLALQGGGSHGAFTWGVLDRLLEDDRIVIEGISGTSAGAMNAAALLEGHLKGGTKGAREALDKFWEGVGDMASFGMPSGSALGQMFGNWNFNTSPMAMMTDAWQRMFSPYQSNPFNINPLRAMVEKMFDIKAIRACNAIKLFVCATNVETGRARIFTREELSADVLMASGCLPFAFQAVMIDGKPYWDGGYVGNPEIFPLIYNCQSPDVVIVQVNPLVRTGTPDTPTEIVNRLNEISFNAALMGEMRAIAFVQHLVDEDHLKNSEASRLKSMNVHAISAEDEMRKLGADSKFDADMDFLLTLKQFGRASADQWLKQNWDAIGVKSSVDIHQMFLD